MYWNTPTYDLLVDGASILTRLNGRLTSITVTDVAGTDSDTLAFEIEVGDRSVALPRKGALISCMLGFEETGLTFMGLYTVDEVRIAGAPVIMSVSAKAADMRASLKQQRTGHFEKKTLGAIVDEIAGRNGLAAAVQPELSGRMIEWLGQTEESDLHLLTRLGAAHGAIASPKNGKLVFAKRGTGRTAAGSAMAAVTISPDLVTEFDFTLPDRPVVKEVVGHWHDAKKGERVAEVVPAGGEGGGFTLRHDFPNKAEATWAAEAKADDLKRASGSFSCTLQGTPSLGAETIVRTSGFYPGTDMEWTVKTATHSWTDAEATTQIECEVKP